MVGFLDLDLGELETLVARHRGVADEPRADSGLRGLDVRDSFETVEFPSQGAKLRGRLYRPSGTGLVPVVVMAHGTSATITMTAERYAEVFQAAGLAVLLYDHRNFGASGGEPRHEINPWIQARGFSDAITFLESVPGIAWTRSQSGATATAHLR